MPIYGLAGKTPQISQYAFVHPDAVIIGDASVGEDCFIAPGVVIRADFGPVRIGSGSSIQDNAVIHVSPGDKVEIGNDVVVAHHAVLHDVTIQNRCIVGMGAVLLHKVTCGEDSFVAAGALVPRGMVIPNGKMVAGNPARIIKDVTEEMKAFMVEGVEQYKALARLYRETMHLVIS